MGKNYFFFGAAFVFVGALAFYMGHQQALDAVPGNTEFSSLNSDSHSAAAAIESNPGGREPSGESDDVRALNSILFNEMKTSMDVEKSIKKIQKYAEENPSSVAAQVYSSVLTPVPLFKGMAYRLRTVAEPIDSLYIAAITELRLFKRNSDRRAAHIDALFDYLVNPNPDLNNQTPAVDMFKSGADFQDYMAQKVEPVMSAQAKKLKASAQRLKEQDRTNHLFSYDVNLLFGLRDFVSNGPTTRYKFFMLGNLEAMIANMEERMGIGLYLASYNIEKLPSFSNTLLAKTLLGKRNDLRLQIPGVKQFFKLAIQSPKEFSELLHSEAFKDFLTLRNVAQSQEQNYLKKSYEHFVQAIQYRQSAFARMEKYKSMPNNDAMLVDPDFTTNRLVLDEKILSKRLALVQKSAQGPVQFVDRITGKSFDLQVAAIFDVEKNPKIKDLKNFYPKGAESFSSSPETFGSNPKTFRWNYEYGKVLKWPDPSFGGVLPGTNSSEEYKQKLLSISRDASLPFLTAWLRFFM